MYYEHDEGICIDGTLVLHTFYLDIGYNEWGVTKLTFEQDPEAVWKQRDDAVKELCERKEIECVERVSHTLYEPMKYSYRKNDGQPPLTYSLFNLVASALGDPPRPVSYPVFHNIDLPVYPDHEKKFGIPKPQTVGVFPDCKEQNNRINEWKGGESKALDLLEKRLAIEKKAYEDGYVLPNQYIPDLLGEPMSMSAHLRFGCLSVRRFHWTIHDLFEKVKPKESKPDALTCQLIWREYFYVMSANNINYDKMEGNPICLNIPWYRNDEILKKWEMGQTGYPWIDAIMNQLRHEGWIHHVGRYAVACFLTRGDLWISWVDGLKIFLKYLIDADWSVSSGNWMWVSSSAFEKVLQCPKCFCPVGYGRRMDRTGEYIRRYLPVLKDMPLRYLFEPWKAPLAVQQKAHCIVGKDYPHPIVNHKEASNECASAMNKMTSGGTESILMACLAYRNIARERGAASYFRMKLTHIPIDEETRMVDIKAMRRAINKNTCMLVGSAPQFPHGIIDSIEEICQLGVKYNIPVHVDCCLGGFLVPFMEKAGYNIPVCDFRVEGVTSISADTHKYAFAPKGSSVILYRNKDIRQRQFFVQPEWPGGIYATSSMGGSRAGAIIAACWATLIYFGEEGYVNSTRKIISTTRKITDGLRKIRGMKVFGNPLMSVIGFGSDEFNIFRLADYMTSKGWALNSLQYPNSVHLCVTYVHTHEGVAERFLGDVENGVTEIMKDPNSEIGGMV
ncbi:CRY [Mytilus edulis]|uniref:Cryptochrome-1 n=1 Tax=Mytilus edulis TaxID=6550 RepID=A0A8S3UES5_MYTED|nr:CRY [Mytilus edulis]